LKKKLCGKSIEKSKKKAHRELAVAVAAAPGDALPGSPRGELAARAAAPSEELAVGSGPLLPQR
jgi:hypothetical protein